MGISFKIKTVGIALEEEYKCIYSSTAWKEFLLLVSKHNHVQYMTYALSMDNSHLFSSRVYFNIYFFTLASFLSNLPSLHSFFLPLPILFLPVPSPVFLWPLPLLFVFHSFSASVCSFFPSFFYPVPLFNLCLHLFFLLFYLQLLAYNITFSSFSSVDCLTLIKHHNIPCMQHST